MQVHEILADLARMSRYMKDASGRKPYRWSCIVTWPDGTEDIEKCESYEVATATRGLLRSVKRNGALPVSVEIGYQGGGNGE